jgi:hypothetical protein
MRLPKGVVPGLPIDGATAPVVTVCTGRAAAAMAAASLEQSCGDDRSYAASKLSAIVLAPVVTMAPVAGGGAAGAAAKAPVVTVELCNSSAPGGCNRRGDMLGYFPLPEEVPE